MGYSAYAPKPAGIQHVPLTGSEPNAILACTCDGAMTDLAGDAVFDADTPLFASNATYDGLRSAVRLPNGAASIGTTTATDHQIAIATAVTYGGMFYFNSVGQTLTPYLMVSGTTTGATNQNYAMKMGSGLFDSAPGGDTFGVEIPRACWFHAMCVENAGRSIAKLYLNGKLVATINPTSDSGALLATNDLWIGELAGTPNNSAAGLASDLFIADAEYSDAQIRTLAENAFGHGLPL